VKIHDMWWAPFLQLPPWLMVSLRENWTPRFPRIWRGRRVTVAVGARVTNEQAAAVRHSYFELRSSPYEHSLMAFAFKDEGVTWCIGWKGPRVEALKVVAALREKA
jgi:hypothetical protein